MLQLICLMAVAFNAEIGETTPALLRTFRSEFVKVMPGTRGFPPIFSMGSDVASEQAQPKHLVAINYEFYVAKFEVPQNLWQAVMGDNPSRWKGPRNSVEMLSFADAVEFCEKATVLMREAKLIEGDEVIRLPSEAEWEYFARAGTTTTFSFGADAADLDHYGWHTGNAAGNDPPVGAKKPNPWGIYDIHGYLWEWCSDSAAENYENAPNDGSARQGNAARRVLRGGSWKDGAEKLTSSYRRSAKSDLRDDAVGLRCVLSKEKN